MTNLIAIFVGGEPMGTSSRREFLADVGRGMLIAGLGPALAADLGLARAEAAETGPERLNFGALEPLVALMQETPLNQLLPTLVEKYQAGITLQTLTAAGAPTKPRTVGGHANTCGPTRIAPAPPSRARQPH